MLDQQFEPAFLMPPPMHPSAKRIEIDEFAMDNAMTNLFLLALRSMMDYPLKPAGEENWFTWYNISACHGFPTELWKGIMNTAASNPDRGYYCTHGSTVFPTWHRSAMHMLEQAIYRNMQRIADEYTEEEGLYEYLAALDRFRMPYWDPCLPRNQLDKSEQDPEKRVRKLFRVPSIIANEEVWVMKPASGKAKIRNPLYRFEFPTPSEYAAATGRVPIDWDRMTKQGLPLKTGPVNTLRCPDADGISQHPELDKRLQAQAQGLATAIWQLINPGETEDERRWDKFANHFKEEGAEWDAGVSLESWHDQVHGLVGVGSTDQILGHMGLLELAAFDPIFWLHHNNVERLFALYQALYDHEEDRYVAKDIKAPNKWGLDSQLQPFQKDETGNCYTSEDVRDWTLLGYAVPGNKPLNAEQKTLVGRYVRDTYFWVTENSEPPSTLSYPKDLSKSFALNGGNFDFAPPPVSFVALSSTAGLVQREYPVDGSKPTQSNVDKGFKDETQNYDLYPMGTFDNREQRILYTWNAMIHVQKYAFNQSFVIQLFIGKDEVPGQTGAAQNYFTTRNQVGFSNVFASTPEADCDNCADMIKMQMIYMDVISFMTVLPTYLQSNKSPEDRWPPKRLRQLESLQAKDVVPFLHANLEWRVCLLNGEVKTADEVKAAGLQVAVSSREFQMPTASNPLGVYGISKVHPSVTAGKAGGYDPK